MPVNFDIVIDTPEYEVDMKAGLDTMQGVSDATRIIGETLLMGKVPERISSKSSVRTTLKKSFKGSYGHSFRLDVLDEQPRKELRRIGNATFSELMAYFMKEALYLDNADLSDKAQTVVDRLGDSAEELVKQLRQSAMKNLHEIAVKFGCDVTVKHRKSAHEQITLAKFTSQTVRAVQASRTDERIVIVAAIRRLNANTGNGRLQIEGEEDTVAFGFRASYRQVDFAMKRRFSDNLHYNNGIDSENWRYMEIIANPIRHLDDTIIKYLVVGFHDV